MSGPPALRGALPEREPIPEREVDGEAHAYSRDGAHRTVPNFSVKRSSSVTSLLPSVSLIASESLRSSFARRAESSRYPLSLALRFLRAVLDAITIARTPRLLSQQSMLRFAF